MDCVWGEWINGSCSATCDGTGTLTRTRTSEASNGGSECTGPASETIQCTVTNTPCPGKTCHNCFHPLSCYVKQKYLILTGYLRVTSGSTYLTQILPTFCTSFALILHFHPLLHMICTYFTHILHILLNLHMFYTQFTQNLHFWRGYQR